MTLSQVMAELKKLGTAQNVKVYKRHGCGDDVFGVSFANLNTLKKKIKTDHDLAEALWGTGNVDARALAMMIADPGRVTSKQADAWVKDLSYYLLADMVAGVVAKSPQAPRKMEKWMASKKEFVRECGYSMLASRLRDGADVGDAACKRYLEAIEAQIHTSPNRARHAMNNALIAIGVYRPSLTKIAMAAARRVGKVEVDHGETSCKTPDAVAYIEKTLKHYAGRSKLKPRRPARSKTA